MSKLHMLGHAVFLFMYNSPSEPLRLPNTSIVPPSSSSNLLLSLTGMLCHRTRIFLRETLVFALLAILPNPSVSASIRVDYGMTLTSHFANLSSISPRLSACSRGPSLSERRTTRAATARYRL